MPSILKERNTISTQDAVRIPEFSLRPMIIDDFEEEQEYETTSEDEYEASDEEETPILQDMMDESGYYEKPKQAKKSSPTVSKRDIMEYYKEELNTIINEETEKAYSDAIRKKRGEITESIRQVDYQLEELRKRQTEFMEKYAYELKYLAVEIAEKIMLHKINDDEMILKKMVMSAIANEKATSWINVEISERLVNLVEDLKKELEKPQYYGRASVTPVAGSMDTCRINTEEGTVVASALEQTKNLRDAYSRG